MEGPNLAGHCREAEQQIGQDFTAGLLPMGHEAMAEHEWGRRVDEHPTVSQVSPSHGVFIPALTSSAFIRKGRRPHTIFFPIRGRM